MIDTGFPGEYNSFLEKLAKININISEIKYLLITHCHIDHIGFAYEIVRDSGAKIIIHKKGIQILEKGNLQGALKKRKFLNPCIKFITEAYFNLSSRKRTFPPLKLTKDDYIISDDNSKILNEIGINGKIIYTPGHSNDSISVLLSNGDAFVGDVATNSFYFRVCHSGHKPIIVQDIVKVYRSWRKLISYGAKMIYPAHGSPFPVKKLVFPIDNQIGIL